MTQAELKNRIGFQIAFLVYSGASEEETINRLHNIAIDYSKDSIGVIKSCVNEFDAAEWVSPVAEMARVYLNVKDGK